MAANENEDSGTPQPATETFNFGEYVSPNPKSIPFGMKFKPDPEIKIVHKTDSKSVTPPIANQEPTPETIANPYLDEQIIDKQTVSFSLQNNKQFEDRHTIKKVAATPLKVKVCKQAKEISSLQAELLKLRIENEKLKNISPANEKHSVVFDETVKHVGDTTSDSLSDVVSKVRVTRKNTPFKGKPKEKELKFLQKQSNANQEKKSRGDYRITPIPQQNRRRKIVFKSKLQSICDATPNKENVDRNNENDNADDTFDSERLAETAKTPKHLTSVDTPNSCAQIGNVQLDDDKSFNLGQKVVAESGTPSFLQGVQGTPDVIDSKAVLTGNGASNHVSPAIGTPILTPVKGMANNAKRFEFSWNKKR